MEMYKQINKSISQQNQELRQVVASLKNDNIALNHKLMSQKELVIMLRRTILRCVSQASHALNQIVSEVSSIEMREETREIPTADNTNNQSARTRQTIRHVPPELREPEMLRTADESVERFANVQMRRRRLSEPSKRKDTASPLVQDDDEMESDEDEVENNIDVNESDEDDVAPSNLDTLTRENSQSCASINRDIRTIIEENTITDSQTSYSINVPRTIGNNIRENQSVLTIEDSTTFDNFSALKAMSSTPYKTRNATLIRPVRVLIQKLKPPVIKTFLATKKNAKDKQSKRNDKENKSANNLTISNCSRNTRNSTQVLAEISSNINETSTRPKRRAAPASLKEPNLTQKLRRK